MREHTVSISRIGIVIIRVMIFSLFLLLTGCAPHELPTPTPTPVDYSLGTPAAGFVLPTAARVTPAPEGTRLAQQQAWLQVAGLGPDAPSSQDWPAIEEAARREGKVTVYSSSSRLKYAAEAFMQRYPEIQVEALDMGTRDAILTLQNEQAAGDYRCDVYFAGDLPTLLHDLLPARLVWPFVPTELQSALPERYRDPLPVQRLSVDVVIYNSDTYQAPPIDNWWDLTRPEWSGKIVLQNPLVDRARLYLFVSMVQQAERMAEAYQAEFGQPIKLDPDCPNAAYQWIKAFLTNQPTYLPGSIEVAQAVGAPDQFDPPLGIVPYAQYTKVVRHNLYFEPLFDLTPFSATARPTYLAIANRAPHPNAAKLIIRWLMGEPDEEDMGGFAPWWALGEYSPRRDIPDPGHAYPWQDLEPRLWPLDNEPAYDDAGELLDFWLSHAP